MNAADTIAAYRALPYIDLSGVSIAVDMLDGTFEGDTSFKEPTLVVTCQPELELAEHDVKLAEMKRLSECSEEHRPAHHVPAYPTKTRLVKYSRRLTSNDEKFSRGWLFPDYGIANNVGDIVDELRQYQKYGDVTFTASVMDVPDDFKPEKHGTYAGPGDEYGAVCPEPFQFQGRDFYLHYRVTPRAVKRGEELVLEGFSSEDHVIALKTLLY